jgi:ATP-binding cassette, subfamily B, bacterial PglK
MFVLSFRGIDIVDVLPVIGIFSYAFIRLIPVVSSVIKSLQNIKYIMPAIDVIYSEFNQFNGEKKYNKSNKEQRYLFKKVIFSSIKLNSVVFFFGTKKKVNIINNLTLQIDKGQVIGISGPSGSGKTTLMNIVLGLLKPDEGRVLVNDKDIQEDLVGWRSLIGYVPQSITLIDASIRSNIALGIEDDAIDNEKIWSVLKEASLFEFVKNLPSQLDTFIGENGIRISGGQRQRLGLARALYHDPEVMVFDEATSALDVETEKRITGEIMKLSGKRTVIIVAHRISTIKECDVIYYMKGGEIVNFGTYNELKELNIPGFMNDKSES